MGVRVCSQAGPHPPPPSLFDPHPCRAPASSTRHSHWPSADLLAGRQRPTRVWTGRTTHTCAHSGADACRSCSQPEAHPLSFPVFHANTQHSSRVGCEACPIPFHGHRGRMVRPCIQLCCCDQANHPLLSRRVTSTQPCSAPRVEPPSAPAPVLMAFNRSTNWYTAASPPAAQGRVHAGCTAALAQD